MDCRSTLHSLLGLRLPYIPGHMCNTQFKQDKHFPACHGLSQVPPQPLSNFRNPTTTTTKGKPATPAACAWDIPSKEKPEYPPLALIYLSFGCQKPATLPAFSTKIQTSQFPHSPLPCPVALCRNKYCYSGKRSKAVVGHCFLPGVPKVLTSHHTHTHRGKALIPVSVG
ncbi:UNVERIFIED_CONTAM: hypothetical protein K2H54_060520 [Gekko kuhli]